MTERAAVELFAEGFSCSQAVLAAFADGLGLDRDAALGVGAGFGGGMGRMGMTCGAVTGAFMVLGLAFGARTADDEAAADRTRAAVREFAARFSARHGGLDCRELLGCDLSTDDGLAENERRGLSRAVCPALVADAVAILEDMLPAAAPKPREEG